MFYQLLKGNIKQFSEQTLKRGEFVYHEGEKPEYIYLIESGLVGLFHLSETGKETFFRVFTTNDIFGHRSVLAEEKYHASSMALTQSNIIKIPLLEWDRLCREYPQVKNIVTKQMAKDLGNAELRMAGLLDKTAKKRITESLVYMKLKYPTQVWTRKEIAEYSGSTLETVARVMSSLEKDGYLKKVGRDFEISNPDGLLQFVNEEEG